MKTTTKTFMLSALLCLFGQVDSHGSEAIEKMSRRDLKALSEEESKLRQDVLESRLQEIKGLDFSQMSKLEKKALKREIKEIKKQHDFLSGGVYLSVGAVIIILLLLILLT